MIIKMGFEITNIRIEEADEFIKEIEEFASQWAIDMTNKKEVKGFSSIRSYMFGKSITNEKVGGGGI
ncbi:MAG: hypothetical protein LBQ89_08020 [Treponema sp.]|jgi:hypothetical protein|nr:hypothetical protein [Treponema sp.]